MKLTLNSAQPFFSGASSKKAFSVTTAVLAGLLSHGDSYAAAKKVEKAADSLITPTCIERIYAYPAKCEKIRDYNGWKLECNKGKNRTLTKTQTCETPPKIELKQKLQCDHTYDIEKDDGSTIKNRKICNDGVNQYEIADLHSCSELPTTVNEDNIPVKYNESCRDEHKIINKGKMPLVRETDSKEVPPSNQQPIQQEKAPLQQPYNYLEQPFIPYVQQYPPIFDFPQPGNQKGNPLKCKPVNLYQSICTGGGQTKMQTCLDSTICQSEPVLQENGIITDRNFCRCFYDDTPTAKPFIPIPVPILPPLLPGNIFPQVYSTTPIIPVIPSPIITPHFIHHWGCRHH